MAQLAKPELVIGGDHRVASSDGSTFEVKNPATNDVLARVPKATADDAKAAIDEAEAHFEKWSNTPAPERAEVLYKIGEIIRSEKSELAELLTIEEGKAFEESLAEIVEGYDTVMFIASEGRRMWSYVSPSEQTDKTCMVIRRPVGIVGIITPWNFPFSIPLWKIPPALLGGNTVVFKPASNTPLIGAKIVELFERAGLPKGVLNFVTGPGSTVGEALLDDKRIKMISFTGESKTGHRIAEANSRFLRKQLLELGGKNPVIVAKDADLSYSVGAILYASFSNCGQKCTAASRIIVEREILKEFVAKFAEGAKHLRVGNGLHQGVQVGPLISPQALEKVESYVQLGREEGAHLVTGGGRYSDAERSRGNFYQPTLFDSVSNDMRIAQEEIFGPVTAIIEAQDMEDAIRIANDTKYGLSSAIYTRDVRNAFRSLSQIQSGIGYVNQGTTGAEVHLPFGGVKESGFGREAGEVAIENYTEKKAVFIDYSYKKRSWYF
ncbi:MAG TPA: aldehyde dehydrogenase family protein [Nitrososphaerales archaeon]|nr:aldehyde dehydrogenase family protein [Nitrososphaerales archaeon]